MNCTFFSQLTQLPIVVPSDFFLHSFILEGLVMFCHVIDMRQIPQVTNFFLSEEIISHFVIVPVQG